MNIVQQAYKSVGNLDGIIEYMRNTTADQWQLDVVRSKDGERNCFFGHLFNYGIEQAHRNGHADRDEEYATRVWEAFEEHWGTTFRVYPINDGEDPGYPQPTARERILAYLKALQEGREMTTQESMELSFQISEAAHG